MKLKYRLLLRIRSLELLGCYDVISLNGCKSRQFKDIGHSVYLVGTVLWIIELRGQFCFGLFVFVVVFGFFNLENGCE